MRAEKLYITVKLIIEESEAILIQNHFSFCRSAQAFKRKTNSLCVIPYIQTNWTVTITRLTKCLKLFQHFHWFALATFLSLLSVFAFFARDFVKILLKENFLLLTFHSILPFSRWILGDAKLLRMRCKWTTQIYGNSRWQTNFASEKSYRCKKGRWTPTRNYWTMTLTYLAQLWNFPSAISTVTCTFSNRRAKKETIQNQTCDRM